MAKMEAAQEQAHAERVKLDEKWLSAWDALDDGQKDKVAQHFAERAEKFAKHAELRKQHRAERKADGAKAAEATPPVSS